ncbi:sodium:solute symporter [Cyanobium sp. ATX 6A2]|uniref:sodium/glutamate symporter n=1 Tax=Cyanobium sp. ATX 6A2 TaxID=2823700 RepID=UPI0020CF1A43|nr:sodium:solute symporter [Cyanobium sp. ATX 6A2]MCP9888395.1 sodium:solute symporter [Cyanobium sp. ATX 6A2]
MNVLPAFSLVSLAFAALGLLLALGRAIGPALGLQRLGLPAAVVAGLLGLAIGPEGPWPLLPAAVEELWARLPTILLTLVFATLMLGRPLPALQSFWRPAAAQTLLGLTLGFGQYLMGALAVLLVLGPLLGVNPLMACLIEVGFEGGHGSAAVMGPIYADLGFGEGGDLGLAMATVGLLSSTVLGGVLVVIGQRRGWLMALEPLALEAALPQPAASPHQPSCPLPAPATGRERGQAAVLMLNLGLAGLAVGLGVLMQAGLDWAATPLQGAWHTVVDALPVYPLALAGSLLVRLVLERSGFSDLASPQLQTRLGGLATDLLITAAMAGLNLAQLTQNWLPLTVLAVAGLGWNLLVVLVLARRVLPVDWFERAVTEFGQATGVAASGLLLLGMADPSNRSEALPAFSIKQLLLQPVLAGGVVTVAAPLAVHSWGLPLWCALCFALTVLWITLALLLARRQA